MATQNMGMDILTRVNGIRAANGLKPLRYDTNLDAPALVRATEASRFFSHTRPNGTEWYTVNENLMYGENLAEGYHTADEVVNAWMASPEHKANILKPEFTTMGIGIARTERTTGLRFLAWPECQHACVAKSTAYKVRKIP